MRLEVLGSGGATTSPRPGCACRVCEAARADGVPNARTGPAYFLHDAGVLVDTSEDIRLQLNRSGIDRVPTCFYSHWHPDHTMGRRIWETLHADWRAWPPRPRGRTDVYLPQQVAADFRARLGLADHLAFLAEREWVRVFEVADGQSVDLGAVRFTPFRLAERYVYAFVVEGGGRRILLAPDETNGWQPPASLGRLDLAVLPMGICEHDPLTGERRIHASHPVLALEATFPETLAIVEALDAARVVLSHVEELDGLRHEELEELGRRHGVEFAYDGMLLEV